MIFIKPIFTRMCFLLIMALLDSKVYADSTSISLVFSSNVCQKVTYRDVGSSVDKGTVQPQNGKYTITISQDFNGSSSSLYDYYCWTYQGNTTQFKLDKAYGTWQPRSNDTRAEVDLVPDKNYNNQKGWLPCAGYISDFAGWTDIIPPLSPIHCSQESGVSINSTSWSITSPSVTLPLDWQELDISTRTYYYAWWQPSTIMTMHFYQEQTQPPIPPVVSNNFELRAYLTGNWIDSNGKYEYAGEDTSLFSFWKVSNFCRVPLPDPNGCTPYQYIGMSIATSVIQNMESNSHYSCSANITSNFGFDSGKIPITVNGVLQTGTPWWQLVDETNYNNKGWYKEFNPQNDSRFPLSVCNMKGKNQTLSLSMSCNSNQSGNPVVTYPVQTINSYTVQYFPQ